MLKQVMRSSQNNKNKLKQFMASQQMELVDDAYVNRLIQVQIFKSFFAIQYNAIQEHEPDPFYRNKQLMSYEVCQLQRH